MLPSYKSGDRVLTLNWFLPKKGDVVVFKSGKILKIKRVINMSADLIFIAGDNKKLSSQEKPVERQNVIGKVIVKY